MKKNKGSFTIEATLSLFLFLMLMLVFLMMGRWVLYQNKVKHSLNQAAVNMSMKNYYVAEMNAKTKAISGFSISDLTDIVNKFGYGNLEKSVTAAANSIAQHGAPYTKNWGKNDLKLEAMRYFAVQYLGIDYEDLKDSTEDDIIKMLNKRGLEDFEMEGGYNGEYFEKGKKVIFIKIKYKINTGLSPQKVFGIDIQPEFSDSVKFVMFEEK